MAWELEGLNWFDGASGPPGAANRWGGSARRYRSEATGRDPDWDSLLFHAVVTFAGLAGLVLATGHLSALLFEGGWPSYRAAEV